MSLLSGVRRSLLSATKAVVAFVAGMFDFSDAANSQYVAVLEEEWIG